MPKNKELNEKERLLHNIELINKRINEVLGEDSSVQLQKKSGIAPPDKIEELLKNVSVDTSSSFFPFDKD